MSRPNAEPAAATRHWSRLGQKSDRRAFSTPRTAPAFRRAALPSLDTTVKIIPTIIQ